MMMDKTDSSDLPLLMLSACGRYTRCRSGNSITRHTSVDWSNTYGRSTPFKWRFIRNGKQYISISVKLAFRKEWCL